MPENLTQSSIKTLTAPKKGNKITYDTKVKGLGLRVTSSGAKSFILNYHIAGRERRYTIGRFPEWTITAARERAALLRRQIDEGQDPLEEKAQDRLAKTVKDLWAEYEEMHLSNLADQSQKDVRNMWATWIIPELGRKRLDQLSANDIDRLHRKISKKTQVRANRVLEVLRKALNLAIRWQWIKNNPADGFKRNIEQPRHRYLSQDEISRLLREADNIDDKIAPVVIRLLLLTGARLGEVLKAKWEHFDLEEGIWTKPSSHTKQKLLHRVPLSGEAILILKKLKKSSESEYLFPTKNGTPKKDIKWSWGKIIKAANLEDIRLHDLRHTYASVLASEGLSLPIIGQLLGHTQAQTTQRYAHLYDGPLRKATSIAAKHMKSA